MAILELTLILKQDGVTVPGFPVVRRMNVTTVEIDADGTLVSDNLFHAFGGLPLEQRVSFVRTLDRAVTVRLNGQTDAGVDLNAGGLILVFDGDQDSGVSTNLTVRNASGQPTALQVLVGGV